MQHMLHGVWSWSQDNELAEDGVAVASDFFVPTGSVGAC
jgi:hypothetical protein